MNRGTPLLLGMAMLAGCSRTPVAAPATTLIAASPATPVAGPATSPVVAFHGTGSDWQIDLQAEGGPRLAARLRRGRAWSNATVVLTEASPAKAPTRFTFAGTLFAPDGDTPLHLRIDDGACRDPGGVVRMQVVEVAVQGAATLKGCGSIVRN